LNEGYFKLERTYSLKGLGNYIVGKVLEEDGLSK
jgi:hypothetical protein